MRQKYALIVQERDQMRAKLAEVDSGLARKVAEAEARSLQLGN